MCKIKDPFLKLLVHGLLGALIGLVGGFLLGLLIWGGQTIICLTGTRGCHGDVIHMATFLGSGAGAFLGALMGSIFALKKNK
jgi:hypothetical protein